MLVLCGEFNQQLDSFDIAMVAGIDNGEIIGLVGLDVLMIVAGIVLCAEPIFDRKV